MAVETLEFEHGIRAHIEWDQDAESPTSWDNVGQIAYTSLSYTLGTERVSRVRMDEIAAGIRSGELLGLPVYAYVHSGATIRVGEANPFSCPWDSGQSGFVYCTREKAIAEFGKKRLTAKVRERALACLRAEVETYDMYLTGDVYGVVVEDATGKELDSCWGFYGLEYAREEAESMGKAAVEASKREGREAQYWAERDVATGAAT